MKQPTYRQKYGYLPAFCIKLVESGPDGEELMMRVIQRLGGREIRIPKTLSQESVLVRELGIADAERVWRACRSGGDTWEMKLDVPRMADARRRMRLLRATHMLAGGAKIGEVATALGVTERAVYGMLQRARERGLIPERDGLSHTRPALPSPQNNPKDGNR